MENNNIFEQARNSVSEGLIRRYFDCSNSEVKKGQLFTLCPFRNDQTIGSFNIDLTSGLWKDFSASADPGQGDFIKLVELAYNLKPFEAAKKIVTDSGGTIEENKKSNKKETKKKKGTPVLPIPEEKLKDLENKVKAEWWSDKFGIPKKAYKYYNDSGLCFIVIRFERQNGKGIKKEFLPFYYSENNKFETGLDHFKTLPLYNQKNLNHEFPVLIVEGEKCANIEVDGFNVITWQGGSKNISKADWSVLDNYKIIIWPDNDTAGIQAASRIKNEYLHNAEVLKIENKPTKWDIADAKEDGTNIEKFIETCPRWEDKNEEPEEPKEKEVDEYYNPYFKYMGHDDGRHFFLTSGSNIVKNIGFGKFTNTKLLELAPLAYWLMCYPAKNGYELNSAIDDIIRESEKVGYFDKTKIRGAGVWKDDDRIIINTGKKIVSHEGKEIKEFKTKYFYVHSEKSMGNFTGDIATNEEGEKLMDLFLKQGFETHLEALAVLGWALISPFAGILKWRPHIWITGPTGCGKSYLIDEIVKNLVGPFHHSGSGNDTAPGIYRSLRNDPAPILLDEMEVNKQDDKKVAERIQEKIFLARNASSDSSGKITMGNFSGGTDSFFIRSPFCFASIVPSMQGHAIENRIIECRLKNINLVQEKMDITKKYIASGLLDDTGRFRRKILKNIEYTIKYIEILRDVIKQHTGEVRLADNLAPILAASFSVVNDGKIPEMEKVNNFVREIISNYQKTDHESDEDKLLREIFDHSVKIDPSKTKMISELIYECASTSEGLIDSTYDEALQRHGIKIYHDKDGIKYLAIVANHREIKNMLAGTMYYAKYSVVLKRHDAAEKNSRSVRFSSQSRSSILLKWDMIKKMYFEENNIDETLEIPF